jgi:DNA-binding XRE family transcriptional regulator
MPEGVQMIHELNCWPTYFDAIWTGDKTCEVRQATDRSFQVGDELRLYRLRSNRRNAGRTGKVIHATITHIVSADDFRLTVRMLKAHTVVLSFRMTHRINAEPLERVDSFPRKLRRARQTLALTQSQLASRIGLHKTSISRMERAKWNPNIGLIQKLEDALHLQPGELINA